MKHNIAVLIEQSVNVVDSLNMGLRFTEEEESFLCEHFERVEMRKGDFTIRAGEVENYLYFIESGILRYWVVLNENASEKETTFWFSFPGEFANSYLSFQKSCPSSINMEALSDSIVWRMSKPNVAYLYAHSLNVNRIGRMVLEDAMTRKIRHEIGLLGWSCEENYKELLKQDKEMMQSIPLKYIASYIGVTPQTLSQIRKRIG